MSDKTNGTSVIDTVKLLVAIICVAVGISVVVALVVKYGNPTVSQTGAFECEQIPKSEKLKFNSTIVITCVYPSFIPVDNSTVILEFVPEISQNQTEDVFEIDSTLEPKTFRVGRWNIKIHDSSVEFYGDTIICGGNGFYRFTLLSSASTQNLSSKVDMKFESEADQMDIRKSEKNGVYEIVCSTSGYPPATILIQRTVGNNTFPLYSLNSSCAMGCNEYHGWSARCTGSIPKNSVRTLDEISCRSLH